MMLHALVPVKTLDQAKSRLAPLLAPAERQTLALAMLGDVLTVLRATPEVDAVTVVSADTHVRELSLRMGASVRSEEAAGLNWALTQAAASDAIAGAARLLVLFADLPLLTVPELSLFIEHGDEADVVLGAAGDGGTNALLAWLPLPIPLRFGTASLTRHRAESIARGLRTRIVRSPGLSSDIDQPDDLLWLIEQHRATESGRFVRSLPLLEQLAAVGGRS